MPARGQTLQRSSSWLRKDRGLDTYTLQHPDVIRLPHQVVDLAGRPPRKLCRTSSNVSEPEQRWWLREVTHDKSLARGLYEVVSGLVSLYPEPRKKSQSLGLLRAGTRFMARPVAWRGTVWLKIQTQGVSPPLFTNLSEAVPAKPHEAPGHRLFATSGLDPLPASEDLAGAGEIWVEQNLQYITRIRDIGREQGQMSYNLTAHPAMQTGKWKFRKAWD